MSGIGGKKRENNFESLQVGLAVYKILAVNPSREEYEEILGIELKEESKATNYLSESKEGNTTLRVDFWGEEVKSKRKQKVSFFLEDKKKTNKTEEGDGKVKKFQYINTVGTCSWADEPENLPDWFTKRDYRIAFVGEEEFYAFMRTWLGDLDYRSDDTVLQLDWKKLMKGNVNDIKDQIGGEFSVPFIWLNEIKTVTKVSEDGTEDIKEYQSIYNRGFLPEYTLKNFRATDYTKPEERAKLTVKLTNQLKPHERFVLQVTNTEYGSKNFFILKDLTDYDATMNVVASNKTLQEDDATY